MSEYWEEVHRQHVRFMKACREAYYPGCPNADPAHWRASGEKEVWPGQKPLTEAQRLEVERTMAWAKSVFGVV